MLTSSHARLQGNCTGAPPSPVAFQITAPSLLPLKQEQCLLVVAEDTLNIQAGNAWLDNIYFRLRSTGSDEAPTVLTAQASGRLWATNVTIQGDGSPTSQAIRATNAQGVYADGMHA